MLIVSACLAGIECRYNGEAYTVLQLEEMVRAGKALPLCPEIIGGLATPRAKAERQGDAVVNELGEDVGAQFTQGAKRAVEIALLVGCRKAILKAKSPSCGCGRIYDGTFSGRLIDGDGIFCSLLKAKGIEVWTEEDFAENGFEA